MFCLMCGDVWVGDDRLELIHTDEPFYINGDLFICPVCYPFFKSSDKKHQSKILHSHPEMENLEGKKVCKNCLCHDLYTWECGEKSKMTLIDETCENFREVYVDYEP